MKFIVIIIKFNLNIFMKFLVVRKMPIVSPDFGNKASVNLVSHLVCQTLITGICKPPHNYVCSKPKGIYCVIRHSIGQEILILGRYTEHCTANKKLHYYKIGLAVVG